MLLSPIWREYEYARGVERQQKKPKKNYFFAVLNGYDARKNRTFPPPSPIKEHSRPRHDKFQRPMKNDTEVTRPQNLTKNYFF